MVLFPAAHGFCLNTPRKDSGKMFSGELPPLWGTFFGWEVRAGFWETFINFSF